MSFLRTLKSLDRVFVYSLSICATFAIWGVISPESLADLAQRFTRASFENFDWLFLLTTSGILAAAVWVCLSRYGKLVLGKPGCKPDFTLKAWLSMLFAAGMGTGIMFWGVAEPLTHFSGSPGVAAKTPEAAREAMLITSLHWGLHAWAIYAMAALCIAYFGHRRGSSALPGESIRKGLSRWPWAELVGRWADVLAVVAVVMGVAATLSMGTLQTQGGLAELFSTSRTSAWVSIAILAVIVVSYTASAATSLDKGIKWLSGINIVIALTLMLYLFFAGPSIDSLRIFVTTIGDYLQELPSRSLTISAVSEEEQRWVHSWTLNYFVWWIAWAPFVGVFIARISRGRTIREFIIGVVFVPSIFSVLWFSILGGGALLSELSGNSHIADGIAQGYEQALFDYFSFFGPTEILSATALLLLFVFMVTSVDSATYVLGMLTSEGALDPPRARKLIWGAILGALGVALTLTRNVDIVRSLAIVGAIPFTPILVLQMIALFKTIRADERLNDFQDEQKEKPKR